MTPLKPRGRGRPRKVVITEPAESDGEFANKDDFLPEEAAGIVNADDEVAAVNDELENADIVALLSSPGVMGSIVKLSKVNDVTLAPEYITSFPAKNFDPEHIKKMYGGGEYLMAIVRSNGKVVKHARFNISRMFKGDINAMPPMTPAANSEQGVTQIGMQLANMLGNKLNEINTAKSESDSLLPLIMQQQRESAQMQMQMLVEFAKSMRPTSSGEPMSWVGVCAPIIIELIRNFKKEGSSLPELIGALVQLRELTPGGEGGNVEVKEKSVWDKIIESVAPALAPALVPALMQHVQKSAPIPALPPKQVRPPTPPVNQSLPVNNPPVNRNPMPVNRETQPVTPKIKTSQPATTPLENKPMQNNNHAAPTSQNELSIAKVMPYLLKGAENDTNPESYYDLTKTFLSGEELVQLVHVLENENWKQIIFAQYLKEIEPYGEWFSELRDCFINPDGDEEEEDDEEDDDENEETEGEENKPGAPAPIPQK